MHLTRNSNQSPCITVINGLVQNNQFNLHVHVNSFGQESKGYITPEYALACFGMGWHGIDPMIDEIYFNKDHPENRTMRLVSLKNSLVKVKDEDGWKIQGLSDTIDKVIQNTGSHIVREASKLIPNDRLADDETVYNMHAIRNIEHDARKKIRERTRAKLVDESDYYLNRMPSTQLSKVLEVPQRQSLHQ